MRKYYQAALAVTAIVSLVSLLVYRHEYNKLRYVLEVFNYFGKPNQKIVETNCANNTSVFTKFNMKFDEPVSSWQRLDNDLYVYSAYSINAKEVQVIAFGTVDSIKDIQCVMFFQNEIKPVLGSFQYISINSNSYVKSNTENSKYSGYHFLCKHARDKIPVAITFLTKSNTNVDNTPMLPIKNQLENLNSTNTATCVMSPLAKPMHSSEMISFINFHDVIGLNNFIVYDMGIPNEFNSYLKDLSRAQNRDWKFTYTAIPWNFPFPDIDRDTIRDIIEADCLYRTYNKVIYALLLSWDEYIVLKHHHSIMDLMADFKRSRLKADRYKLTTSTFCTQQADDPHIVNITYMIFRKTHFDESIIDNYSIYIHNSHEILKKSNIYTREIGKELIVLNRYRYCYEKSNPETKIHDTTILRFTDDLLNSAMYRTFMRENRFSLTKTVKDQFSAT